jgi:hypothetical protein
MQPKFPTKYLEFLEATSFTRTKIGCVGVYFVTPTKGIIVKTLPIVQTAYGGIFYRILSIPHNIVMALNMLFY